MRVCRMYRWVAIALIAAGLLAAPSAATWQEGGGEASAPSAPPDPVAAPAPPAAPASPTPIRFSFKGATFEQVIDFFSRTTGLPVVWETDPPEGTLDYVSPESYALPEALRVLNIILQSKGVMLRVHKEMLYLQKLTEMQREDIPTYVGELPADVGDEQIITVVLPLNIALAKPLAERLAELIASYGSVSALEQQNALVVTETASQVRRILRIVEQLDREDPEGAIEIFTVRHTRANLLMEPLKALLSQKVEKYVIDQKGKQVKIEEDSMPGLSITADERTNTIIAKGVQSRIDKLAEVITLLDVPATNGGRAIRTIALGMLSPEQARTRLNEIYQKLPEPERPTVIAMSELGSVTIVGSEQAISEAATLLREIDGGDGTERPEGRGIAVVALEHADPGSVLTALKSLLNGRQVSATRLVPGPDGRSIIISATHSDLEAVRTVIPALDRPARADRQVRLLRLTSRDPAGVVQRSRELFEKQVDPGDPAMELSVDFDAEARTATLVGTAAALDRFANAMRMVEGSTVVTRESRQIEVTSAEPSRLSSSLAALARQLLQPTDGTPYVEPTIVPIDPLDVLLVTALPEQFGIIESLVQTLDEPDPRDHQFRVIPLTGIEEVDVLLSRAADAYDRLTRGYEEDELPDPEVEVDALTGNLLLTGRVEAVRRYEQAIAEARRLLPPARTGRMIALRQARAAEVIGPLRDLIARTAPVEPSRAVPDPIIEVIEPTNSLYVVGEAPQLAMIDSFVRQLDTYEPTDLPPLRLLQVRAADANQLATMLRQRYDARPSEQRRDQPVTLSADAGTNTLIITAHEAVFEEIREFVENVNRAGETGAERETMIFALQRARATDLATALDKLYPQPPMPLDRRGRPMPHLREPKEVYVSADAATNTLIVEAPAERRASFEALVEQLDRVELPPTAELRTYYIDRGDPGQIARTLNELARQNVLSAPEADGGKRVEVTIQAEPLSRTLIVAGDDVTFTKVEEVLEDLKAVPVPRDLRVIEVDGADPQDIADRAQAIYAEQTAEMRDAGEVTIEVDRAASVLYVVAAPEAMVRMVGIVNQLQTAIGPPPDVRLVTLEFATAGEVVQFLQGLASSELANAGGRLGPPPLFEAIERTNSVLIAAAPAQHQVIAQLIRSLDKPEDQTMPPLRILQLRTADAANLANALTRQYNQRPSEERRDKPVQLAADPATNALLVAAHPDMLPEIQSIVAELNEANRIDTEGREIRIFPLKVARAEELARTIDEMFPAPPMPVDRRGRPMPGLQEPREVVVRADPQTNSLIVDAPVQRMAGFEQLVEQLDRQKMAEETEIRTFQLMHAELRSTATTLQQLANTGTLSPSGSDRRVPVTIATEPVSRMLIVSGPKDIFPRVEQVLSELDAPPAGPGTTLRFFKLAHARAESLAPMLREILLARIREDVPEAGANVQSLLNVSADRKTNTLIISAPSAVMPVVEELVQQLDDSTASIGDPTIRVKPLTFADARDVSTALTQALPGMISPATGDPISVRLIPSSGSNAMILVGLADDLEAVEAFIDELDARPAMDAIDAQTFALEFADANTIAPVVERLLTDQQETDPRIRLWQLRQSRGQMNAAPRIRVEADQRTNALIVSGPQRTVALAQTLIEQLDQPDESASRTVRTFTPVNADPARLAQIVKRVVDSTRASGRRSTLELIAEPASAAIVVIGTDEETDRALALLQERDEEALVPPAVDFQVLTLAHSDANVVARAMAPMLADGSRWPAELQALARAGVRFAPPTVTADAASNRLLITAPAPLMALAGELVGQLDVPRPESDAIDVRLFSLTQARANEVAQAVRTAMDARSRAEPGRPPVAVAAEPSSNSVVVTATPVRLEEVAQLIESLDTAETGDRPQVRTVFLKHARAESVAPIVEQLLGIEPAVTVSQVPSWMIMQVLQAQERQRQDRPEVRVIADTRLNAVVIAAPVAQLNVAEQMIAELDVDPGAVDGAATRTVRVLSVENADARELATNLEALFSEPDQVDPSPTIRVDGPSNALIIRATDAQFKTIEEVTRTIDEATIATSRQMQMIPIDPAKASAADVARTLQRLLDRGQGRVQVITLEELIRRREGRPPPGASSSSDPPPGSTTLPPFSCWRLLAGAAFAVVQDSDPEVIDPAAAALIQALGDGADITIAVDEATNSLVVIGAPRAVQRILALADQIQQHIPDAPGMVHSIVLPEPVDAASVARLVAQTVAQLTPPGGRRGDLRRRTSIVADPVSNTLLIVANDHDFVLLGDLVAALGRPSATDEVIVKIYPLETITADRAASSVEDLIATDDPRRRRGRQAQRLRNLAVTLLAGDTTIEAVFDPDRIRVSTDAQTNSLIVMAPAEAIAFVDQFIALIDQTPQNVQATLKLYPLRHAQADDLRNTLRNIFRARFQSMRSQPGAQAFLMPEFASDDRTNTLLVTASPEQLAEVDGLLDQLDRDLGEKLQPLRMIELTTNQPQRVADIVKQVVIGSDQARRTSTLIVPDDPSGRLLVRASDEVFAEIEAVVAEVDRDAARAFPVRTIILERADANAVAQTLQRFFDDRARIASEGRGRRRQSRTVSIIGDPSSKTLLVAASDEDYAEIETLVRDFDTIEAAGALTFRVYPLEHAKVADIEQVLQELIDDLTWNQGPFVFWWGGPRSNPQQQQGTIAVRGDKRLNALIVTGEGDKFDVVEQLIELLDAPIPAGEQRIVRVFKVEHAPLNIVEDVLREMFTDTTRARRWWEEQDPTEVQIRSDRRTSTLIVSGAEREMNEVAEMIASLEDAVTPATQEVQVLAVEYARADEVAQALDRFLRDRADAAGGPPSTASIVASRSANSIMVSAAPEDMATVRDLVGRLDQPDVSGERAVEIIVLREGDADEIARIVREQFGRRGGQGAIVTPDVRTNTIIMNAPREQLAQARALIERLDAPSYSDETIIRTYALEGARAQDAVRILTETLQLDARGETKGITIKLDDSDAPAVEVRAKVTADRRSNSLIVTATEQSFPVIESLISKLDDVPPASPVEYRIVPLEHALASDVYFTLTELTRQLGRGAGGDDPAPRIDYNRLENQLIIAATADQFEQIGKILTELDQPSPTPRVTDFVPLQFAEAEKIQEALSVFYGPYASEADTPGKRNVRIVADPATNSLVISAEASEWDGIRALLAELDSEEYDSSLQLRVFPLRYADARSVARAINDAFQGSLERGRGSQDPRERARQPRAGRDEDRREPIAPTVLVESEEWVRASAEEQTNSVVVSASRQNIRKIETIIEQLDVADYAKLPAPRLIPVATGSPEALAASISRLYEQQSGDRGGRALRIVGDPTSSTVIVRAEEDEFEQIRALADAIQQEASDKGLSVRVLPLGSAPAARVATAIRDAFQAKAAQTNQPLSIQVDRQGNSLIVASTGGLFEEIEQTVKQLDAIGPASGQGIFIIELQHISPDAAKRVIETIGLDKPQRDDSVSRLVTEPITITPLNGRNAVVVVANPADRETVIGVLKALDAAPTLAESHTRIVRLHRAQASALANILNEVLTPSPQQASTPLAQAVQEQVRRLAVRRDGIDEEDLHLDLTRPIRVIADASLNAILISSTPDNVQALEQLVHILDDLPITQAVTVQIFPLENIAADQFARVIRELFQQGKQLGSTPGSDVEGVPAGMVGKALLDEIALSVDERTNTVVVAGAEDAVAFVEVLAQRLDSDVAVGWVEPRLLMLRYADATDLAQTLQSVLVEGQSNLPQATPLQRQIGRIRMARVRENGGRVIESDVFQPMTRLVIRPEAQLNALILVGTPKNLEVVTELVGMLDVEAASPDATVRIYPIEHASASRLAGTITSLFDQQAATKAIRPEDRVIVQADERTNALIVTTSPRSFAVLEGLLDALDAEIAPDLREIRTIVLNNASAPRLAGLIQQLMDARLERLRKVQPETADLERATIVADPRTNSLVVAAGNESFEVIKRLAAELDDSSFLDTSLIRLITIEQGNADRIAATINEVMERRYADLPSGLSRSLKPLVLTDPRSNSLLVAANPEDLAAIDDLVIKLESAPSNPAIALRVIPLSETVRAELMAPRVERLMRERQQSLGEGGRPSDRTSIEVDPVSNSLIVAASDENQEVIADLVRILIEADAAAEGEGVEVIMLTTSRAAEMVDLLDDLYVTEANRTRGANTIRVTADERLNAVLVNAPERDVRTIRGLVDQLDGTKPASVVEIRYVPLKSANALETVNLIESVLSGRGLGGRRAGPQATVLKYLREIADRMPPAGDEGALETEMEVSAAIRESITLTPDLRTNTVIVSAPSESMEMIVEMIRDLDSSTIGAKNIRIFKLENADATAMAEIITDLFNLRQGNELNILRPREYDEPPPMDGGAGGAPPLEGPMPLGGVELTVVPDVRQQLSITVDSRTNSLLVSGSPTYLDLVEQVVLELDAMEANEREVFVYQLRNATAEEVARVIGDFIDQEQQKLVGTLSGDQLGSAARLLEREVTIQGDAKSNTVLVSASPRYMEQVREMIRQLDVDPPQVLIQVMLAEVTLDTSDDWGVDMDFAFGAGSATVTGGFSLANAFITGMGVPNLAIASTDFDLLINAVQAQGRLQVLSNPSIMAANNEPARIQIGDEIRLASTTSISDSGQVNSTVAPEDIGVILEVTPSINPDGFVRLTIHPEISILTNETTQISENFETPIIRKREADTTVTVHDGQTVVLGGLISDRYEKREEKVPFLGDLPIIGALFRATTEETATTELLIVLTPYVIASPSDFDAVDSMTRFEIDRLSVPDEVKERIRANIRSGIGGVYDAQGRRLDTPPDDQAPPDGETPPDSPPAAPPDPTPPPESPSAPPG